MIDLTSKPPKITQSLTAGAGATTFGFRPMASWRSSPIAPRDRLGVHRRGQALTAVGKIDLGNKDSLPSGIVFATMAGMHC